MNPGQESPRCDPRGLHALRLAIGDRAFFQIAQTWAAKKAGGNATTAEFIALAQQISGRDLGSFFAIWLGSGYPLSIAAATSVTHGSALVAKALAMAPAAARSEYLRYGKASELFKGR